MTLLQWPNAPKVNLQCTCSRCHGKGHQLLPISPNSDSQENHTIAAKMITDFPVPIFLMNLLGVAVVSVSGEGPLDVGRVDVTVAA